LIEPEAVFAAVQKLLSVKPGDLPAPFDSFEPEYVTL
jgi:hypothetical protein